MALKARIDDDLKTAILGRDRFGIDNLRGLKAAILNEEVAQKKRDEGLDDTAIEQLIAREVKKRNESAMQYDQADRAELAEAERSEAKFLQNYLPEQLSEDEIRNIVETIIKDLGVSGPAAMGQTIGAVKKQLGSSADGAIIAKIVKETLN